MSQDQDNTAEPEDDLGGWLRDHPEAHNELADLQRLREVVQSVRAPQPEDAAWTATLAHVHAGAPAVHPHRKRAARPLGAILSLTAAAALICILLARSWWTKPAVEEPFMAPGSSSPSSASEMKTSSAMT